MFVMASAMMRPATESMIAKKIAPSTIAATISIRRNSRKTAKIAHQFPLTSSMLRPNDRNTPVRSTTIAGANRHQKTPRTIPGMTKKIAATKTQMPKMTAAPNSGRMYPADPANSSPRDRSRRPSRMSRTALTTIPAYQ